MERFILVKKIIVLALALLVHLDSCAVNIGNLHFFRAQPFCGEPRLERCWLASADVAISGGSTNHSYDDCGNKRDFLAFYGDHAYKGHFHLVEATLSYIQNFVRGFFAGIFVPVRSMHITNICRLDCISKEKTPLMALKKRGVGDVTLYGGWTINYQDTLVLDYIDATVKVGALIPTGAQKNSTNPLSIPLGYGGHPGLTLCADGSLGVYDWLTVGAHFETIIFFSKNQQFCPDVIDNICSAPCITANVHKGAIWQICTYVRADHLIRGLSALVGYSYTQQRKESVSACLSDMYNSIIIPRNSLCNGWSMHTVHTAIEYDFTQECMRIGPRIGAFYDIQVKGKNTLATNMGGGMFGLDIVMCY